MNAFHRTNLGTFGESLPADSNGYVPDATTGPWELTYDHGTASTHAEDGSLTEYGAWWEAEWPVLVDEAIRATEEAQANLSEWQNADMS